MDDLSHLSDKWGISRERIVFYGQSSMAPLVIMALIKQPHVSNIYAVVCLIRRFGAPAPREFFAFRLRAFHGGSAPVPSEIVRDLLIDLI